MVVTIKNRPAIDPLSLLCVAIEATKKVILYSSDGDELLDIFKGEDADMAKLAKVGIVVEKVSD